MAFAMRRQLKPEEKEIVLKRHGRICYATGHEIPEGDVIHFDHINAYSAGGETDLNNVAPMCQKHNLEKGTLPLEHFRIKLKIDEFFRQGDRLTLKNLLEYLKKSGEIKGFGERITAVETDNKIKIENHSFSRTFELQECPLTKWKYFYCTLPVSLIDSDDDDNEQFGLQPRYLIPEKVFEMFRHFLDYPVLQPSIGRIVNGRLLLFDGQHKAAALLWSGRQNFECKIYLNPEINRLNQANISAHDKFAQTRFYASIMILKLGAVFGKDFEAYKDDDSIKEKTEVGFIDYLAKNNTSLAKADITKRFRSYLYDAILNNADNKCEPLISKSNKGSKEQPLTFDMISKSIFLNFLCRDPLFDNILTDDYKRDAETKNIIRFMNGMFDRSLVNWNAGSGCDAQLKLKRIFTSKAIIAWSELVRDAVCVRLKINDSDDKAKIFYRDVADSAFDELDEIWQRLFEWKLWRSPKNSEIDTRIAGNKSTTKAWMKEMGLTVTYLLGMDE